MLVSYNSSNMDRLANFLQAVGYRSVIGYPYLAVYCHLLVSAVFPIYAGAHASLSRPSSAAKTPKKTKKQDDQDDEPEERKQTMEGLGPTDALLLPLFAGLSLASLYFLINWLEDPALLNKILNWYFAVFGVWSLAQIIRDGMVIFTSFIFPKTYATDGNILEIEPKQSVSWLKSTPSVEQYSSTPETSSAPLLISKITNAMWTLRGLSSRHLDVRVYIHNMVQGEFKIGPQGIVSVFLATVALLYFNLIDKPWWLTNLLGFGFAYNALQIMSPTTSWTGTLILIALFVYDIYFVFFTPLMVTVATQLDIPAKLLFPRPRRPGEDPEKEALFMLGLGDIILPGMMIGFALRFDLYLFYLRKQSRENIQGSKGTKDAANGSASKEVTKPTWYPATGVWGERFWTPKTQTQKSKRFQGVFFPKTYFRASLIGYVLGMFCTLGVMNIYGQAQPALLYLVPGVLGSLWGTALVKGDITELWKFDEAEEEKEAEARSEKGKSIENSAWKPSHWLGWDWDSILLRVPGTLKASNQPKNDSQNDKSNDQTTNGQVENAKETRSSQDPSEKPKSSSPTHGATQPNDNEPQASKASADGCKGDKAKEIFNRDRKSELLFISINLAPTIPSNTTSPS